VCLESLGVQDLPLDVDREGDTFESQDEL
jgi:hypothetical protein